MALKLVKILDSKLEIEYFELKEAYIKDGEIDTWLIGYKSELDKLEGAEPAIVLPISLNIDTSKFLKDLYKEIKKLPDWVDAIDIEEDYNV